MSEVTVPSRGDPVAAVGHASPSAGECGDKDQVSCSGAPSCHLAIVGPTAAGKTALALAIARSLPFVELVSVDAMAVYRGLDVGTAKPRGEDLVGVRWHLVDLVDPSEEFSVAQFQAAGLAAVADIEARGHRAVLVGGTGLYHRTLVDSLVLPGRYPDVAATLEAEADRLGAAHLHERLARLDPRGASRIEPGNRRRVVRALEVTLGSGRAFSEWGPGLEAYESSPYLQVGLALERGELDRRIALRLERQLADGFVEEARTLARRPGGMSRTASQAIGYRELLASDEGTTSLDGALAATVQRTRTFARRQERWFRRDPRVQWVDALRPDLVSAVLALWARET